MWIPNHKTEALVMAARYRIFFGMCIVTCVSFISFIQSNNIDILTRIEPAGIRPPQVVNNNDIEPVDADSNQNGDNSDDYFDGDDFGGNDDISKVLHNLDLKSIVNMTANFLGIDTSLPKDLKVSGIYLRRRP